MKQHPGRFRFLIVNLVGPLLLLYASTAFAQTATTTRGRLGIGTSISDVGEVVALEGNAPPSVIAPTILVPIDITSRFRIEPEVGYYRNSTRNERFGTAQTSTNSSAHLHVGAGAFGLASTERFTIYYGVRVAYLRTTESSVNPSFSSTLTAPGFFVAPALGGEYFLWDRFSLGAEVQVRYTSSKMTGDGVTTSNGTTTNTTTSTHGAIVVRFYVPG
jgi:hypothetical protein